MGQTYRVVRVGSTLFLEHRLVWAEANGPVPNGFDVHHVDEDRHNNNLDNLQPLTRSEHRLLHAPQYPPVCMVDGCVSSSHIMGICQSHYDQARYQLRKNRDGKYWAQGVLDAETN